MAKKGLDFSFSGLKTSVLYYLQDQEEESSVQGQAPRARTSSETLHLRADANSSEKKVPRKGVNMAMSLAISPKWGR